MVGAAGVPGDGSPSARTRSVAASPPPPTQPRTKLHELRPRFGAILPAAGRPAVFSTAAAAATKAASSNIAGVLEHRQAPNAHQDR